jgi:uncharacterized membrane protein YagU involved in acid resistance
LIQSDVLKGGILAGAGAGLVGGLVFGVVMLQIGLLPTIALLIGAETAVAGFIVHMIAAAMIGAGFGLFVWHQRTGAGETLLWGLAYGIFWWVLGPLTFLPLFLEGFITWDIGAAQETFPALLGHILYGATTGLVLAFIRRNPQTATASWRSPLLRGSLGGLLAAWLLGLMLNAQDELVVMTMRDAASQGTIWLVTLSIGMVAGIVFAWLYSVPFDGAGAGLIRGTVYGFLWWVVGARTLFPLLNGDGLTWTLESTQGDFVTFPGYLLFGATTVLFYQWLHRLSQILFSDHLGHANQESVGTEGLRALGRGLVAGLIGGMLFTIVMVQIGFLPTVASLVGSTSPSTGFIIHLLIANLIGMSYGLLFRRQSYDIGSALGWGISYGFVWWLLGPLTLLPVLLGGPPQWTLAAATAAFPALVGHLAYGAGLGGTFYLLEARDRPWWVSRTQAEATRLIRRKEQVLSSAPAVWVLVVVIALVLPVTLGM